MPSNADKNRERRAIYGMKRVIDGPFSDGFVETERDLSPSQQELVRDILHAPIPRNAYPWYIRAAEYRLLIYTALALAAFITVIILST